MIRNGFVSNSSSSSFILYYEKENKIPHSFKENPFWAVEEEIHHWRNEDYVNVTVNLPFEDGELNFGWQWDIWKDFKSKVNYMLYQASRLEPLKNIGLNENWPYKTPFEVVLEAVTIICTEQAKLNDIDPVVHLVIDYNSFFWDSKKEEGYVFEDYEVDHNSLLGSYRKEYLENEEKPIHKIYKLFKDVDKMVDFLTNKDFYIIGGNDNADYYPDYYLEGLRLIGEKELADELSGEEDLE